MGETIEEYFSDTELTQTNLHDSAALIYTFLTGGATCYDTAQGLMDSFHGPNATDVPDVIEICIVEVAEDFWEMHEALVKLMSELRSRQQQHSKKDLTEFDDSLYYSLRERWVRYGDPDPSSRSRDQERLDWTSLNRFTALLYAAGFQKLADFGKATLSMTLRRNTWRINWSCPENTSDSIVALQGHAPAAAHWINISGQCLYDDCKDVRESWTTWTEDMDWIASQSQLNEEARPHIFGIK
ncbi:hypothetical protein M406DRAFT_71635 [Cryphonectria parasitica EP155]|uniref:Uncharacterized protein n=1 Tax=Cryphonectria parasitica (strain ATCC 38755 / EP155) TaxID=660469 RepID=A0A9P5CRJ8_CRYP1|nr:uncharacterized protein M406DRAFT_71635 [Cryphonectria parasitica EP155]KAF3768649.1 hypothetical protein M406DRAFT_71635 [Cryphonectria parasitica EP155]